MAGVKGRSGGARPGAGAKKKTTEEAQLANRDLILEWTTAEDVKDVFMSALAGAKAGRAEDRKFLEPYWFGSQSQNVNVNHKGNIDHTLREVPDEVLKALVEGE